MDTKLNMQELDQVAGGRISCYDNNANYSTNLLNVGDNVSFCKRSYPSGEYTQFVASPEMVEHALNAAYPDSADEIADLLVKMTDSKTQYQLSGKERQMFLTAAKAFLG